MGMTQSKLKNPVVSGYIIPLWEAQEENQCLLVHNDSFAGVWFIVQSLQAFWKTLHHLSGVSVYPRSAFEKPKENQNTKRTVAENSYILYLLCQICSKENLFHKKKWQSTRPWQSKGSKLRLCPFENDPLFLGYPFVQFRAGDTYFGGSSQVS